MRGRVPGLAGGGGSSGGCRWKMPSGNTSGWVPSGESSEECTNRNTVCLGQYNEDTLPVPFIDRWVISLNTFPVRPWRPTDVGSGPMPSVRETLAVGPTHEPARRRLAYSFFTIDVIVRRISAAQCSCAVTQFRTTTARKHGPKDRHCMNLAEQTRGTLQFSRRAGRRAGRRAPAAGPALSSQLTR